MVPYLERGVENVMDGEFSGVKVAYVSTSGQYHDSVGKGYDLLEFRPELYRWR